MAAGHIVHSLPWQDCSAIFALAKDARSHYVPGSPRADRGRVRTLPLDRADGPHERSLRQEPPSPSGHPRDRDPRRARAQSQEHRRRDPARPAGGVHRALGLGQILARLRHHLRRGPAPLRRVPLRLRPAVPGDDAEAGRRPDRRPLAGDLDRAEDHLAQSALDRRHRHRDLRLHAAPVGAHRRALFARHRAADREPDGVADGRPGDGAAGGHAALSAGAGGARTQGRVPQGARRLHEARLPAREDRRQLLRDRRGAGARQEIQPRHRRGGGPHRGAARHRDPPGGLAGDGAEARRGPGGRRIRRWSSADQHAAKPTR